MLDLSGPLVLDGGLSTALEQQGADLGGALWTARLLADEPARIATAHRSFFEAGARVATTASYQASVEGLVAAGYDASEATSIFASWASARDNARRAREVIPLELWECINTTWHQLPQNSFGVAEAHTYLSWARERSALFTGIARGTMVRDEGWQFLLLGRSLEQIDMTSRMNPASPLTETAFALVSS